MKKILILFFAFLIVSISKSQNQSSNEILFQIKDNVSFNYKSCVLRQRFGNEEIDDLNTRYKVSKIKEIGKNTKTFLVRFKNDIDINEIIKKYTKTNLFEYVEPNFIGKGSGQSSSVIPNDTYFNRQYALHNDGTFSLSTSTTDADIDMDSAWSIEQGSSSITVAVLDAGLRLGHPEFSGRLWVNADESFTGSDSDGNGYNDDINGWDFANNDNDPTDDHGHGTNITGIIAANGNNGTGYAGVDWNCKIMTCKILDNNNSGFYSWWASALYYATDNGADVINMSVGGSGFSSTLQNAINYAYNNGVVIVACMMNEDNSVTYYPAGFANSIAVGATNPDDTRADPFFWSASSGSNFGNHIDVVAPGNYMYGLDYSSDINYNSYWGGTSQATPLVTGLASLLLAQDATRTPDDIRTLIRNTAEDMVGNPIEDISGFDIYYGYGRINAHEALKVAIPSQTDSLNFNKLSTWTSPNASAYNDCWGYADNLGNEYAILGSNWGTHFINISDPYNPIEVNSFQGGFNNVTWRDFKTNGHYAYGVADGNNNNSLQIFDLQYLPDSVVKVYDNQILSTSAHNVFIENDRMYLGINSRGGQSRALDIFDISNPIQPVLINEIDGSIYLNNGRVHDVYVKDNIAYCSAEYSGQHVLDLTDPNNPIKLGDITIYSQSGYNHSSWVDADDNIMVMADEVPIGLALKMVDVSDFSNITEITTFQSNAGATPHNPFIRGNEVYISYYEDGMRVFNISDPNNPIQTAFYDTYPDNGTNYTGYEGNWGVYPFFESRNVIASDITYGLFVLGKENDVYTTDSDFSLCYPDSNIAIDYEVRGTFNPGNIFHLELSDSNGTFRNPTTIASLASTTGGTINATLPSNLARGNRYRVRVRSTSPAVTEGEYQQIYLEEENSIFIDSTICAGDSLVFAGNSYNSTGNYTGTINGAGCDTSFTINLVVSNANLSIKDTFCGGTFSFNGQTFDSTGIYSGIINNVAGCDTSYTLDLLFEEIPSALITLNGNELSGPAGYTYQWLFNNQVIIGATGQTYSPPISGNYSVIVSNGSCENTSNPYNFVLNSITRDFKDFINIYPNPSNGLVNIEVEEKQQVEIFNILGEKIKLLNIEKRTQIHLEKGVYFFRINGYSEKVIID